ncbi:Epoxide hydrolase (EC [Amycolatopsis camponoti]|uniref:Epoxide hydrolase (EC) n=1 Tax=Amycolatopsis camponoti TaxID=2606593 RepID=A0A6I8LXG6_9PSEU|nr:epoxide hydrolase N-terminal domain-containing protein [Amycolatopsis camponoti]VVJ21837.1 Epoxide hydrolase (EC [Amycolatopsis camponoti]
MPEFEGKAAHEMTTLEQQTSHAIRPFTVSFRKGALDDLRHRLAATRWPSRELVGDRSQGVQLATIRALVQYWANGYDLGRVQCLRASRGAVR